MEPTHDLITNLPDQILLQILSFLSLKQAIRTTTLATSWRRILCSPQTLNFNLNSDLISQFISNFLGSYDFPEISKLSLKLSQETNTQSSKTEENLSLLATKGGNRELHLNFFQEQPNNNFNLKLEANPQNPLINYTKISGFSSLKILNLRSVTDLAANMVNALFSNFGSLEVLKIEKCVGLRQLDVKMGGSLKRLMVVDCPDMEDMRVFAPNLRSFWYKGVLAQIELKDAYQVFDVMLDMSGGNGFDCEEVLLLLEALKDVEVLTLSGWLLEWLCSAGVIFKQLGFGFSKLKELQWIDSSINRRRRDSMTYFLDICPSLERLFINIDGGRQSLTCPHFHLYWHEPYFEMDYATLKNTSLQVKSLKVIKMEGFKKEEEELLLLDLLLKKAIILKSMSVTSVDKKNSWEVVKIPLTQLKVTASRQPKQTATLSPCKDYYLGYVEKDDIGLSPFHVL